MSKQVDELNRFCNDCDDRAIDRSHMWPAVERLYADIGRAIDAAPSPQHAWRELYALYDLIYGRSDAEADRGPRAWRDTFIARCRALVDDYRRNPQIASADYLTLLLRSERMAGHVSEATRLEYIATLNTYLLDIDRCPADERRRRIRARRESYGLFAIDNRDRWSQLSMAKV